MLAATAASTPPLRLRAWRLLARLLLTTDTNTTTTAATTAASSGGTEDRAACDELAPRVLWHVVDGAATHDAETAVRKCSYPVCY